MPQISLILGTGMCGLQAAVDLLHRQLGCTATFLNAPFLPWNPMHCLTQQLSRRLQRLREKADPASDFIVDAGWFYLPYVEQLIEQDPGIRLACLQRPQAEVVDRFVTFLKQNYPRPTTYWQAIPPHGWQTDPVYTQTYPEIDAPSLIDSVKIYWEQYAERADLLARRFPEQFQVFQDKAALETFSGQQQFLEFLGLPRTQQRILLGRLAVDTPAELPRLRPMAPRLKTNAPTEPARCLVLVPYYSKISLPCHQNLKRLEQTGYIVRRVQGYAAIDQARNQLATDALIDGFDETLWIDPDCLFHPTDIDRFRGWQLPVFTATETHNFGEQPLAQSNEPGQLKTVFQVNPLLFHVRRQVYADLQHRLPLPIGNERFQHPIIPYFRPLHANTSNGFVYLNDWEGFSQRVLQVGHQIHTSSEITVGRCS